ncbi:amphi-Trp domain-containing protein [Halobacteriaceae bacterium SHR40]|uniref:amphi-Trp domain-containing protein n=1 Tax=Halovenus amylolytica TaxID=2500550 RepID=UPI000FE3F352
MAEETKVTEQLTREQATDRLNEIARELREGEDMTVSVGNKDIALSPSDTVNYSITVVEKQSRFRGSRETIQIELDWKPK